MTLSKNVVENNNRRKRFGFPEAGTHFPGTCPCWSLSPGWGGDSSHSSRTLFFGNLYFPSVLKSTLLFNHSLSYFSSVGVSSQSPTYVDLCPPSASPPLPLPPPRQAPSSGRWSPTSLLWGISATGHCQDHGRGGWGPARAPALTTVISDTCSGIWQNVTFRSNWRKSGAALIPETYVAHLPTLVPCPRVQSFNQRSGD